MREAHPPDLDQRRDPLRGQEVRLREPYDEPATDKQINYIQILARKHDMDIPCANLTKGEASGIIARLRNPNTTEQQQYHGRRSPNVMKIRSVPQPVSRPQGEWAWWEQDDEDDEASSSRPYQPIQKT